MKFTMVVPCDSCPFRKGTPTKLHLGRIEELSEMMLDSQGATFACHKTVDYSAIDEKGDGYDNRTETHGEIHCAGALAYALNHDTLPQLARIMERLVDFDGDAIQAKSGHLVWGSIEDWLEGGSEDRRPEKKRRTRKKSRG